MSARMCSLLAAALLLAGCAESNLVRSTATDTTPPTVVATLPASGAENVTEARVVVTFSEPMSTATVRLEATPGVTWGSPTWSDGDRTATFVPSDLKPNTRYTVRIVGRDRAGNNLTGTTSFTFTTGSLVQAGVVAENLVQNRVFAGVDERLYAVFLAWVASQPDRVLQASPEEHRRIREVVVQRSPEAVRRAREFFEQNAVTPAQLVEAAFWLTPDLRAGTEAVPVAVLSSQPASPTPGSPPQQNPRPPSAGPSPGPSGSQQPTAAPATPAAQAASPAPQVTSGSTQPPRAATPLPPGLAEVVREVYEQARGRELWAAARAEHEQLAQQYRVPTEERVRQATTYLRLNTFPFERLVVVPNLLGPRDQVREVLVAGVLNVVAGPSSAPNVRGVLRAFLRAVLEPPTAAAKDELDRLKGLYDLVRDEVSSRGLRDWEHVVRESLVRAVEARLFLPARDEQDSFLDASFSEGLILVRHFAGRLDALERGQVNLHQFVQQALQAANADQLRQQWQGRSRR
ncbi:MAG: Ig-like domain-containing protein [Armatimonadota bacterium]|nr:Ig-like domain-containing protein [Armatimonadota bacterium]MDR7515568.1 Ig-like domain-containing protein [Armatimonadota bacterium]MDR7564067.1 Ig-like domain-containing protein [Armatimonadota bacterium]